MRKLFIVLFALVVNIGFIFSEELNPDVVFTSEEFNGLGTSAIGSEVTATKSGVTFHCDKAYGDQYGVRCYKNSVVTITSADQQIGKIVFEFATLSGMYYNGGLEDTIIVNGMSWTNTMTSQARMNKVKIYFGEYEQPIVVSPDTISVAQALAIGATLENNAKTEQQYTIIGYVSAINVKNSDAYSETYKNQSFWIADEATSTASTNADGAFYVYRGKPETEAEIPVGMKVQFTCSIKKTVSTTTSLVLIENAEQNISIQFITDTISVAQALAIGESLSDRDTTINQYVITGYVSSIRSEYDLAYQNEAFWITDSFDSHAASKSEGAFYVWRGRPENLQPIEVGTKVQFTTSIQKYKNSSLDTLIQSTRANINIKILNSPEEDADVVFSYTELWGQGISDIGGSITTSKNGVTFTCDYGYGYQVGVNCYENSTITISSTTHKIGKIIFEFSNSGVGKKNGDLAEEIVVNDMLWINKVPVLARIKKVKIYFGEYEIDEITVAQAMSIGNALEDNTYSNTSTVVGYVTSSNELNSNTQTFYMMDDINGTENMFCAYESYVENNGVMIGDFVKVTGNIKKDVSQQGAHSIRIRGGQVEIVRFPRGITNVMPENTGIIETSLVNYMNDEWLIVATPNYGYHFEQWSDGISSNPRTITLTQDTTFTAIFAKNIYYITTESDNSEWGTTSGDTYIPYLEQTEIQAIPNYGYHFVRWNDGNNANPRTVQATQDINYTATFAKNVYSITKNSDNVQGSITGLSQAEYLENVTLEAVPNYGYHFTQWSDGVTLNPRTILITRDTIFTAQFDKNTYAVTTETNNAEWGTTTGDAFVTYMNQVTIQALPNYGYHFVRWNDSNNSNPRTVTVTKDVTYSATFAKNKYTITKIADDVQGRIIGLSQAEYLDDVNIEAIPNYGYHFTQWSDGVTDNPRTFVLTQDTTFSAVFAKNIYGISTEVNNVEWGTSSDDIYMPYLEQTEIQAIPNYGYHFVSWNDGNSNNPRVVTVTKDETYTAIFAKNEYTITQTANSAQGTISGLSQAEYLDTVTLEATPKYGYKFLQWSDGIKDNPRTFVLTRDTAFFAQFGYAVAGSCGDNNQLTWTFDSVSQTLSISGEGALNSNYTFGLQAPTQTTRLIIGEGVTSIGNNAFNGKGSTVTSLALPSTVTNIGDYAFAGLTNRKFNTLVLPNELVTIGAHAFDAASYLQTIYFGSMLEEIGAYAFNNCTRVRQMTCLAEFTPNVGTDGLTSISSLAELYVPNEYLFDYQIDTNWSRFVLKAIGATEATVTNDDVRVVADDNTATLTWPTNANADSYSIEITKDGVVFCTLIFNANGQLTGIAFAPSRNGQPHAPAATMTANGMQFTVTGLNSGTSYAFSLAAKSGETVLASYTGEFETTGAPAVATDLADPSVQLGGSQKILRNNQILILRGDRTFTITGQEVR